MTNEILIFIVVVLISTLITYFLVKLVYEKKLSALVFEKESIQKEIIQKLEFEKIRYEESKKAMNSEFKVRIESYDEKLQLLEDSKKQMKLEFESLANKLFEENSKKSSLNLNQVLTPFKEQLDTFGKRVNDIYNDETKQRVTLLTEIKNLKDLNNQISQDAINLTKALKGENKTQGDWGEMILSKILEQTGLREGIEYSTQGSFTSEEGKRLRPDVIVHLPQDKDVIIDSKVSLLAYTNYVESEDEVLKEKYDKKIIKSIYVEIENELD